MPRRHAPLTYSSYDQTLTQQIELAGEHVQRVSKPGLPAWDQVAAAHELIALNAVIREGMRVLVLESGAGALAAWVALQGAQVHACDGTLIGARMSRLTAEANRVSVSVDDAALPSPELLFDIVLMINPKGRTYARLLIEAAYRALPPGGRFFFAGANATGAESIAADVGAIFGGKAVTVANKARSRVCRIERDDAPPEQRDLTYNTFTVGDLTLFALPGVFSADALDDGTAMLLDTLDEDVCADKRVLDMGCGVGVIGFAAARHGASQVDLVDANWLALDCARRGAQANDLETRCRVIPSDLYSDVAGEYDLILSNPPFHIGHGVDTLATHALIAGARERLTTGRKAGRGGALRIVANRFLPYDKALIEVFGACRTIAEDTRFRVLEARR
jgi:16S rRNA (guanine1207-N2)-methyltransferase